MAKVTLDLATKVIPKEQVIWAVFPGRGRRMLEIFLAQDIIFLETPGINMDPAVLEDDDRLRRHLAMSEAKLQYLIGARKERPSDKWVQYPIRRDPSFNASVGNVRNMFQKMKRGDLIITSSYSIYKPVHAGEIISSFRAEDQSIRTPFEPYEVPVRHVRWFRATEERRFLSERLSRLLANRRTVIHVDKNEFGEEIYKLAYGDFAFRDDGRYVFPGPLYKNIATSTVPGIELISYFVAAFHASELGELDKFAALDIAAATSQYFQQESLHSFELDFSSPGNYVLHSRRAALAMVTALLVSATAGTLTLPEARAAEVTNSADKTPDSPHEIEIKQKYHAIMASFGADRYNQLIGKNKLAQQGVGLKVNVKQKKSGP